MSKKIVLIDANVDKDIIVYYISNNIVDSYYHNDYEYEVLKEEYSDFKSKVFDFVADNNLSGLMEYLKEQGLY